MTVCNPKARLRSAVNQRILACNIRISYLWDSFAKKFIMIPFLKSSWWNATDIERSFRIILCVFKVDDFVFCFCKMFKRYCRDFECPSLTQYTRIVYNDDSILAPQHLCILWCVRIFLSQLCILTFQMWEHIAISCACCWNQEPLVEAAQRMTAAKKPNVLIWTAISITVFSFVWNSETPVCIDFAWMNWVSMIWFRICQLVSLCF